MQTELQTLELTPDLIPVISKTNVKIFHNQVKERIKETGNGLFEYLEFLKFCAKLQDVVSGDSNGKTPEEKDGDKELREMVREHLALYGKAGFSTARGVLFKPAETGTKYNFELTGDDVLPGLEDQLAELKEKIKARTEYLKNLPLEGVSVVDETTGNVTRLYPPSKSSKSSYTVTLPK